MQNSTSIKKKYITVLTKNDLKELYDALNNSEYVAVDTETTGVNTRCDTIIGGSFTTQPGNGFYLPTLKWNTEINGFDTLSIEGKTNHEWLRLCYELLKTKNKKLIMHNGAFDTSIILSNYGIDLLPQLWIETLLGTHTIQEEGAFGFGNPFGLKSIAQMYQEELGLDVEKEANQEQLELKASIVKNGGSTTKSDYQIFKADFEVLSKYACADTDLTFRLAFLILDRIKKEGLSDFFFLEEVMPIYKGVTVPMERRGIMLDLKLIEDTKVQIEKELERLREEINDELTSIKPIQDWIIQKAYFEKYPPSNKGKFAKKLIEMYNLGIDKPNKASIEKLKDSPVKSFLLDPKSEHGLEPIDLLKVSIELWKEDNEGFLINIQSKMHLSEIAFNFLGMKPKSETKGGKAKFDDNFIESISGEHKWAEKLRIYNKFVKINSTYIDRFLRSHEEGVFYPYFKQHGTVSGRYGSDLQQLPRPKEDGEGDPTVIHYNNLIRAFFKARPGYVFIDSDYESLEPHIFASISDDTNLQEIFDKGYDFYSTVAIRTEKIPNVSADKKAPNFLKKVNAPARQKAKAYSLGIPYGMSGYALAMSIGVSPKEGEKLRDAYLHGFPGVKNWLESSREFFKNNGYIKNMLGRIRHLERGKQVYDLYGSQIENFRFRKELSRTAGEEKVKNLYLDYRNALNNCLNFQIQSLAASVVNRAALRINNELQKRGWDGLVVAQIHDQLVIEIKEEYAHDALEIIRDIMENTTKLPGVTLKAPPQLAYNLRDGH